MKTKTIKSILSRKHKQWCESITDPYVRELAEKNTIVTGGAIASMLLKEDVNDFDVYFRTREATIRISEYYVKQYQEKVQNKHKDGRDVKIWVDTEEKDRVKIMIKSQGIASEDGTNSYLYFESQPDEATENFVQEQVKILEQADDLKHKEEKGKNYHVVFMTANAITLSDKIQLVVRFYGEPDEIHENYDFVHCTNYWSSWDNNLVLRQDALEALLARELRYVGSKYPICSVIRLRKFIKRNWHVNAGQILKICMQISQLDLTKISVLEDQLIGVDTAYFIQLIAQLKENNPETVDTGYLMSIIDKIF